MGIAKVDRAWYGTFITEIQFAFSGIMDVSSILKILPIIATIIVCHLNQQTNATKNLIMLQKLLNNEVRHMENNLKPLPRGKEHPSKSMKSEESRKRVAQKKASKSKEKLNEFYWLNLVSIGIESNEAHQFLRTKSRGKPLELQFERIRESDMNLIEDRNYRK